MLLFLNSFSFLPVHPKCHFGKEDSSGSLFVALNALFLAVVGPGSGSLGSVWLFCVLQLLIYGLLGFLLVLFYLASVISALLAEAPRT